MKHLLKNQTKNLPQTTQHKEEFFNKGSNCTCKFFKEATLQIYNTILLTDGFRNKLQRSLSLYLLNISKGLLCIQNSVQQLEWQGRAQVKGCLLPPRNLKEQKKLVSPASRTCHSILYTTYCLALCRLARCPQQMLAALRLET